MKLLRILYLLFAVLLFAPSCSHTNEQLLQAEQLVETAPDSAMTILQKYNYNSLTDKDKALYGLLYLQIQDKKLLPLEPDSLLEFSLKYYLGKHNDYEKLATCYFYKGRKLKNSFQYENAVQYYMYAIDLLGNKNNNFLRGRVNFDLGVIYNMQRDYSKARDKFWISYSYYIKSKKNKYAFYCILYIGRTYHEEKRYDKALSFYKKHNRIATDSIEQGVLFQEIGLNFYDYGKYDSAKYYLKKILYYPYISNNRALRFAILADLYFDINKIDSAKYYSTEAFKYQPDIRTQLNCYRILVNCSSTIKDLDGVNKYMAGYQHCDDSIRKIDSQTKGSYIETMHNTQKEVAKSRSWIWYLLITILLLISVATVLYLHKHKKAKRAIEINTENYNQQKAEIRKDVMMKKRAELIVNIERLKLKQKQSDKGADKFDKRVKNMYNELLHIQDTPLFLCETDSSLNNIVTKLKENAPDIKEKELIWCCLQLLDVPMYDMLILLDYESVNSLKRMKGRLAPKLGLENAGLLNDYLLNLLIID